MTGPGFGHVRVFLGGFHLAAPTLTGLITSIAFDENAVNAAPQLLDVDLVFTDLDDDFDGGALTVAGLLAEDSVSVLNQGTNPGEIGLSGANVSFGGTVIGTLAGGSGADLTITFNAAASSAAIDALIQNLTYANSSDAPTATRDLFINVTDAAGENLGSPPVEATFAAWSGTDPFAGIDVGDRSTPGFIDLDGDGDLDVVVGEAFGTLDSFRNGTNGTAGSFTAWVGTDPFAGNDVGLYSTPGFVDLDGDGDLDAVSGEDDGILNSFENTTPLGQAITVNVTAENDAPADPGLPSDITVAEDTASNLDLSAIGPLDPDLTGSLSVVLVASAGSLSASAAAGVTVIGSSGSFLV